MDQNRVQTVSFFAVEGYGQSVPINPVLETRPVFVIGSDPRAQLLLDDPAAAPAHAVVTGKDGVYTIEPRFPKLDLRVNGKRVVTPTPLNLGDVVQIGATILRYGQEERSLPVSPPARKPDAVLPVRSPGGRLTISPRIPATAPAFAAAAPLSPGEIYFPTRAVETATSSPLPLLLSLVTIAAIVGLLGFNFLVADAGTASAPIPVDFAYRDGNITIVMFDADW